MRDASRFYTSVMISFDRRSQVARWADADHDTEKRVLFICGIDRIATFGEPWVADPRRLAAK
jgi:hypothetical protein